MKAIVCAALVALSAGCREGQRATPETRSLSAADQCPAVMTNAIDDVESCSVAGTNWHSCCPTDPSVPCDTHAIQVFNPPRPLSCGIQAGTTASCAGVLVPTQAIVVTEDPATFGWDEDTVSMCCSTDGVGKVGMYAVKTCARKAGINKCISGKGCTCPAGQAICDCPPGLFCSSCGASTNKCQACFTIAFANGCSLSIGPQCNPDNPETRICRHFCPDFPGAVPPTVTILGANPLTLECASAFADPGATAADDCGGDVTPSISVRGQVDPSVPGSYSIDYTAVDSSGGTTTRSRTVVVADTTPPAVSLSTPEIRMWPPNKKLRSFTLADCASATDGCAGRLDVNASGAIDSISSNEPLEPGDFVITPPSSFALRAARLGSGDGRVYEVHFTVTDPAGNSTAETCRISVPHNM